MHIFLLSFPIVSVLLVKILDRSIKIWSMVNQTLKISTIICKTLNVSMASQPVKSKLDKSMVLFLFLGDFKLTF